MRVRFTQIIDYWIGIPICVFLTLIRTAKRIFPIPARPQPQEILFIELSEMGSAVLAYSAIEHCRSLYPEARISFLIFEKNRESVDILGAIPKENVLTISDKSFFAFVVDSARFLLKARRHKIDTVIDLELFSRATMILSYLSGARTRVGFHQGTGEGLYRGNLLTHPVIYNFHRHISVNFIALADTIGSSCTFCSLYVKKNLEHLIRPLPKIKINLLQSQAVINKIPTSHKNQGAKIVLLNPDPGEALPLRGWPLMHYINLSKQILEKCPKAIIVVMGISSSKQFALNIKGSIESDRIIDFTGATANITELLSLFSISSVLVTADGGPAHFASLTTMPVVVLFGPETPNQYRPLSDSAISISSNLACSPCLSAFNHRYSACMQNICMQEIAPDTVFSQIEKFLL